MGTWVDFQAVKQAISLGQVLERYGIKLKRTGNELHGRCPIHQGKGEDSFRANTEKNAFQCFSCQAKGNVLDFVAAMEKCNIRDAGLKLQDWFGLAASQGPRPSASKAAPGATGSKLAREGTGDENPSTDEGANEGANNGQKGSNKPLGFELRGIDHGHAYLTGRGISKETAEAFGVGLFSGKGSMSGRCVIPIHNERGELLAYAGRSIDGAEPKYKLPAGFHKSAVLFNLHRATATGCKSVVVVEGFFDCMKVWQAGFPCVAVMGCRLSKEQQVLLAGNFTAALLLFDGDAAGIAGAYAGINDLGGNMWVKAVWLQMDKQPDQMGTEELQALLGK